MVAFEVTVVFDKVWNCIVLYDGLCEACET